MNKQYDMHLTVLSLGGAAAKNTQEKEKKKRLQVKINGRGGRSSMDTEVMSRVSAKQQGLPSSSEQQLGIQYMKDKHSKPTTPVID